MLNNVVCVHTYNKFILSLLAVCTNIKQIFFFAHIFIGIRWKILLANSFENKSDKNKLKTILFLRLLEI